MNDYEKDLRKIQPETVRSLEENLQLGKILYVIAIDQKGEVVVGWPGEDTVNVYVQERTAGQNAEYKEENAEYKVENDLSKVFGIKRFFTEDRRCLVGFRLPSGTDILFSIKNS